MQDAKERFIEKHGHENEGYLDICPDCEKKNPNHAENAYQKYGKYE